MSEWSPMKRKVTFLLTDILNYQTETNLYINGDKKSRWGLITKSRGSQVKKREDLMV